MGHLKKLFDSTHCKRDSFDTCTFHKDKKIPYNELSFLLDQMMDKRLYIGPQDLKESDKFKKREDRKIRYQEISLPSTSRNKNTIGLILSDEDDTLGYDSSSINTDDEFIPA